MKRLFLAFLLLSLVLGGTAAAMGPKERLLFWRDRAGDFPAGTVYVTDGDGAYLTDGDGTYLNYSTGD